MYQNNEVANLTIALIGAGVIAYQERRGALRVPWPFHAGFCGVIASLLCTVIEGVAFPDSFDLLEHMFAAVAGLFFAYGCLEMVLAPSGATETDDVGKRPC